MCNVEQIADCGDLSSLARALYISEKEDTAWLSQCPVSLSSCGNLLAVGYKTRLCFLTSQWISSTDSNSYLISWSGTLPSDITTVLALPICPSQHSSQNGPDWFCVIVGFQNGHIGFYTNTGHLLFHEKLDERPVIKISCHTGTYGTLPDDIHILFQSSVCVISGASLFQTLRSAKAQMARVHAGIQDDYMVDSRSINIRKWTFTDQECINDAAVVGLELKNTYDHFLAASTYGGYDTWYRSVPPVHTLILAAGVMPYLGFHYALEGGTTPPLQDVARAVANKIKSALPGWLGGGGSIDNTSTNTEPLIRSEMLSMTNGIYDTQRLGIKVSISPDRRLAAFVDNLGRVAVLDVTKGYVIRLFKGCRDAQCAFVQIFDAESKKPQLSVVKEIRRAVFLIIYNPKKGLIDIRLMHRGNRVAVFTAAKNGILLYNTCGLIGAEKNYTHKTLNLPEFQCVLIDPDGKLKKFNIPFYYSLEGEHLERSKDLHVLRAIRDLIKRTSDITEEFKGEIIKNVTKLQTLEIKKHCLDLLIRNSETSIEIAITCLEMFWDDLNSKDNLNVKEQKMKQYFANLALITLFYRRINNFKVDVLDEFISKICDGLDLKEEFEKQSKDITDMPEFHLLEDDNCILERLLILAEDKDFKEHHHHSRVSFADIDTTSYKEFVSCFQLDEDSKYISLKPNIPSEKMNSVATNIFKSLFKLEDLKFIPIIVKISNINPKEIVKLVILHVMDMSLEQINIELIEKLIAVLFYLCDASEDATNITYNEISPWWQEIRDMLVDMHCPLRSMVVAMACKAVAKQFECKAADREDAWESVTKENAKWGILIGKLEDISILSIILMSKTTYNGTSLPKLLVDDVNINLKFIYTRGKGSVTELIAKWLSSMGVPPEAIIANELMEIYPENIEQNASENDGSPEYLFVQNNCALVNDNPKIFKWLSLLRRQFPLSTSASYIIANMCWEYAMSWQNCMTKTEEFMVVIHCLSTISNLHVRLGLFAIIWSTYIKHIFEASCRLVNKVGKLPKDHLCSQELGFNSEILVKFLEGTTKYLNIFFECSNNASPDEEKQTIQFEKIWDESLPSLVEVAQDTKNVNTDILNLNYQISCTIYYQCYFNLKCSKPLDTLYDIDYQYALEALGGNVVSRAVDMKVSEKIIQPRKKYLTKLIRTAIETIATLDGSTDDTLYNNDECLHWIDNICNLAELWNIDSEFIRHQHVIGLYHMGYDRLAENELCLVTEPELLLPPLLAITIQRLKRSLESSNNQPEWIVSIAPQLYKRLQNTALDGSIPANPSLSTTVIVLQKVLTQCHRRSTDNSASVQNIKLAELIIENCENLLRRNL
ncbi:rab3 GTPase-activating protein non-catalytic subunit [Epargyreus clarus]|uniref:rab3 GTPase-activating protein non-catalytic subunit n=1 Tax=Epargyreus clarus TaxID=520877 RepID=UPI003C2CB794